MFIDWKQAYSHQRNTLGIKYTIQNARFVKVYRSHKLCRNVPSHSSCGNASGISPSNKGFWSAVLLYVKFSIKYKNIKI